MINKTINFPAIITVLIPRREIINVNHLTHHCQHTISYTMTVCHPNNSGVSQQRL